MKLPNSLVTKHLDQLAQKGLLDRSIDRKDSRRVRIGLTDQGRAVMGAADALLGELVGERLSRIPEDRRRMFLATLADLAHD